MNLLPSEVAALVCRELELTDIAILRLVSRFWNDVASPFLFGELQLNFKKNSFEHLLNISQHPILSECVTRLNYLPNTLRKSDRNAWRQRVKTEHVNILIDNLTILPGSDTTDRDLRASSRNVEKAVMLVAKCSEEDIARAWTKYKQFFEEQKQLKRQGYGFDKLSKALQSFSSLRNVSMDYGWVLWPEEKVSRDHESNPYQQALENAGMDNNEQVGVFHMRSLLSALHQANIQLQCLRIGSVSWRFLQLKDATLKKMRTTLESLERFELHIYTRWDMPRLDGEEETSGKEEFRRFLNNFSLRDFLSAATNVKDLGLVFALLDLRYSVEFDRIFQSTHWPHLQSLYLACIQISKEGWLAFLRDHASTLRNLHLVAIGLSQGSWVDVLEKMQQILSLDSVRFGKVLRGKNPPQKYDLGDRWASKRPHQGSYTCKALEEYFLHGGSCPLRDKKAHPNILGESGSMV